MIDCLLIGHYEMPFKEYVEMTKGTSSGALRDLSLSFVNFDGQPQHALGLLNKIRGVDHPLASHVYLHNADFVWPAMIYLGTYLWRHGFSFDFINLPHLERQRLSDTLSDGARAVAITTTLHVSADPIVELVRMIRAEQADSFIIVGGPFIDNLTRSMEPSELHWLLQYIDADIYVVSSEGEKALVGILSCLKENSSLSSVDNIYYREGDAFVFTRKTPESNSMSENMVSYDLFKERLNEFVTLRTAKSCPFHCSFCAFPLRAGRYQYLKVEDVEKELDAIRALDKVTTLTFIDDTFNVPKARFREIMRMMIRNQYGFKWNSFFRSDHADEETMELMAKAGCEGVFLGVESGSDVQLKRMNKTSKKADYVRSIKVLSQLGIYTHANFVVGFPGETESTCRETMDFISEVKPDTFRAQIWYADPGTPIWTQRDDYGVKGIGFSWEHLTMDVQEACEWVEKMFQEIDDSTWLPQTGFEQWSTYYLQRKGMRFAEILSYLRVFRDIKRAELSTGYDKDLERHVGQIRSLIPHTLAI